MSGKRILLQLMLFLSIFISAANTEGTIDSMTELSAGNLLTDITEGEINLNNNGEYEDGLIDNYDNFTNPGYPSGYLQGIQGVDEYA